MIEHNEVIKQILERLGTERRKYLFNNGDFYNGLRRGYVESEKIVQKVAKEYGNGWIPLEKGVLPDECEEVDVTIEEIDGDVYTSTSWLQDGVWVVKKTALHPKVIAWKPKDAPYKPKEED